MSIMAYGSVVCGVTMFAKGVYGAFRGKPNSLSKMAFGLVLTVGGAIAIATAQVVQNQNKVLIQGQLPACRGERVNSVTKENVEKACKNFLIANGLENKVRDRATAFWVGKPFNQDLFECQVDVNYDAFKDFGIRGQEKIPASIDVNEHGCSSFVVLRNY